MKEPFFLKEEIGEIYLKVVGEDGGKQCADTDIFCPAAQITREPSVVLQFLFIKQHGQFAALLVLEHPFNLLTVTASSELQYL